MGVQPCLHLWLRLPSLLVFDHRPIGRLAHAMRVFLTGRLTRVPDTRRRDGAGAMARALRIFPTTCCWPGTGRRTSGGKRKEAARLEAEAEAALSRVRERANRELRFQAVRFAAAPQ